MDIKVTLPDEEELRRIQEGLGGIIAPESEPQPEPQEEPLKQIPEGADPMPANIEQMAAVAQAIRAGKSEEDWQEFLSPEAQAELEANPTMYDPPKPAPEKGLMAKAGEYGVDIGRGVIHGTTRAVEEGTEFTLDRMDQFDDFFGVDVLHRIKNMVAADMRFFGLGFDNENNKVDFGAKNYAPQTAVGGLASGFAQFGTACAILGVAGKASRLSKLTTAFGNTGTAAKYALSAGKGVAADVVFQDPYEDRMSNLIEQFPMLRNPVTAYLKADPNDTDAEARFKNALEGAGLGLLMDGLVYAFTKGMKKWRGVNKLGLSDKEMEKAAQNAFREADEVIVEAKKSGVWKVTPEGVVSPADDLLEEISKVAGGEAGDVKLDTPLDTALRNVADKLTVPETSGITEELDKAITEAVALLDEAEKNGAGNPKLKEYLVKYRESRAQGLEDPIVSAMPKTTSTVQPGSRQEFFNTVEALKGKSGSFNIYDLRKRLGWPREDFDNMIKQMRDEGVLQLQAGETVDLTLQKIDDAFRDENGFLMLSGTWWGEPEQAAMNARTAAARIDKGADNVSETLTIKTEPAKGAPGAPHANIDPRQPAGPATEFPIDQQVEFIEGVKAKINGGEAPKPFRTTNSMYNGEHMPDDVQHTFNTLSEVMGHERDYFETHTMTRDDVVNEAAGIIKQWCDMNGHRDITHDELFTIFSNNMKATPAVVVQHKALLDDAATKVTKYIMDNFNKMEPDELRRALADDGEATALLIHYKALQSQMDGLGTGAGRTLGMFKKNMSATLDELDLTDGLSYADAVKKLKQEVKVMSPGDRMRIMRGISLIDDPVRKAHFLKATWGKKAWEISNEYWLNAVLSGVRTHVVNIFSNVLKLGVTMPLDRMIGASFGRLRRGKWDIESEELWNEGARAWLGMYHTMGEAWALAVKSFKMGENLLKPQNSVFDMMGGGRRKISAKYMGLEDTAFASIIDRVGAMVNVPTRLLMAADEFTSQLAYRSTIFTDLYLKGERLFMDGALGAGDKDTLIKKYLKDHYDEHFADAMSPHTMEVVKGARGINGKGLDNAMEATFTQELAKNSISKKVQNIAAAHPAFKRFAPFIRTPVNIMMDTLAHSPFAKFTPPYKEAMLKGGRDAMLAQGKMALGSLVCLTGLGYAMAGHITGGGPKTAKARAALLATGWRPYSFRVGGKYISFDRVEPFGTVLSVLGDLSEVISFQEMDDPEWENKEWTDKAKQASAGLLFALLENVSSKTYTQGLAELLNAIGNPDVNAEDFMTNFALSYMAPAFLSQARKVFDPKIRVVGGFMDEWKNRIPGLSPSLPPLHDWTTGKEVFMHGGRFSGVSPILIDTVVPNRVTEELIRFPRAMLGPSDDIGGVKLNPQQISDYARLHGTLKLNGRTMAEAIEKLMDSREYDYERKRIPDTKEMVANPRYNMINRIVQQYRDAAKKELFREHPALRDAILKKNPKDKNAGWAQMKSKTQPTAKESAYQKAQRKIKEGGF